MQRQRVCVCWPEMVAVDEALQAQCMDVCVCVCVCVCACACALQMLARMVSGGDIISTII